LQQTLCVPNLVAISSKADSLTSNFNVKHVCLATSNKHHSEVLTDAQCLIRYFILFINETILTAFAFHCLIHVHSRFTGGAFPMHSCLHGSEHRNTVASLLPSRDLEVSRKSTALMSGSTGRVGQIHGVLAKPASTAQHCIQQTDTHR